jgi:hypothetical protein
VGVRRGVPAKLRLWQLAERAPVAASAISWGAP